MITPDFVVGSLVGMITASICAVAVMAAFYERRYSAGYAAGWLECDECMKLSMNQHRAGIADGQVPFHHDGDVEVIRSHFHGRIGERDESV
jgi:hypothetical protein